MARSSLVFVGNATAAGVGPNRNFNLRSMPQARVPSSGVPNVRSSAVLPGRGQARSCERKVELLHAGQGAAREKGMVGSDDERRGTE